jgi:hypothetical protein
VKDFSVGSAIAKGAFEINPETVVFWITHRKTPNGSSPRLQDPDQPR